MIELLSNPAVIALIGTLFGGVGLKGIEHLLNKAATQEDLAAQIRSELRQDVQALRDEIRKVEDDLDEWKAKYYDLLNVHMTLRKEFDSLDTLIHIHGKPANHDRYAEKKNDV